MIETELINLDIVQRYASAWLAGDYERVVASYHDDIVFHYGGNNPLSGDHVGKPAALRALREIGKRTGRKLLSIVDVMAGPERGCVIARERFMRDGETHELERVLIYTIRNDKLHECWVFDRDQALMDRLLMD